MIQYKDMFYEVQQEQNPVNPNDMWEDIFLVYDHRNFYVEVPGFDAKEVYQNLEKYEKNYKIFPVYAYIHSGVKLSIVNDVYPFNDRWDVSFKGFVLIDIKNKDLEALVDVFIKEWNQYLEGDVWCLKIYTKTTCKECGSNHYELVEDFGHVYGYREVEKLAKNIIEEYERTSIM